MLSQVEDVNDLSYRFDPVCSNLYISILLVQISTPSW